MTDAEFAKATEEAEKAKAARRDAFRLRMAVKIAAKIRRA